MKRTNLILGITIMLLAVMTGCGEKKQSADALITVDVTKSYPKKELLLQDFMDVEYIPLETNDEFITQGVVRDVGKEIILVTNRINDGDIFIFDRKTGKGLRKINRKGQGGEEYTNISEIVLDEDNNEMFVNSAAGKKILVYDLYGKFKRSLKNNNADVVYFNVYNYDKNNLIGYDNSGTYKDGEDRGSQLFHIIISKQDGSVTREIQIPFKEIKAPLVRMGEGTVAGSMNQIIPCQGDWILVELSSDTIYRYSPDRNMTPFLVRTPPIQSMDPKEFLSMNMLTDRYYFMKIMKAIFDFEKMNGFPYFCLMYDKQENAIFEYAVYHDDYTDKRQVDLSSTRPVNQEIAICNSLDAHRLIEAYAKGQLKGKLNDIASGLDEESNPVIRLIKHKKIMIRD